MKIKINTTAALIAALPIFLAAGGAVAQNGYPDRTVRMVVGYPPAGPVDIIARVMGDKLSEIWGQPVVVENVSGAGGNIAGDRVAKATPDGYTLLVATNAQLAVNPALYTKMTYDPSKDLCQSPRRSTHPIFWSFPMTWLPRMCRSWWTMRACIRAS
jgi:tripartite-type tricarboxylate transporter receptor subunit TctC